MRATLRVIVFGSIFFLLCGCGGPGGQASSASFTVSPSSTQVTADVNELSTPKVDISVDLHGKGGGKVYLAEEHSARVLSTDFEVMSDTHGVLHVYMQNSASLDPGTYAESVRISVCDDSDCNHKIDGSPKTVSIDYILTGTLPSMSTVSNVVNAYSLPFGSGKILSFDVAFESVQTQSLILSASSTNNGIDRAEFVATGPVTGRVTVYYKLPAVVGRGIWSDQITLTAGCALCVRQINGTPLNISSVYTVSDTIPGPGGYTLRVLPVNAADLVWSETRGRVYFSTHGTGGNSISVLDPQTGVIEHVEPTNHAPGVLAVSSDGQYLYAGMEDSNAVVRYALPSLSVDLQISLGSDPMLGPLYARDIEVLPGTATAIAVARKNLVQNPTTAGVAIYDDAIRRPGVAASNPPGVTWIEFGASSAVLYGTQTESSSFDLYTMAVDSSGVQVQSGQAGVYASRDAHFAAGILYLDSGKAFRVATGSVIGDYRKDSSFTTAVVPDSGKDRVYALLIDGGQNSLTSFNLNTFETIDSLGLSGVHLVDGKTRLIRWGADGLAFLTADGEIVLVNGSFVGQ